MFAKIDVEIIIAKQFSRKYEIESFRFNPSHILRLYVHVGPAIFIYR